MSATSRQRLAKGIRWAARVIGLLITAFFLLFLIGQNIMANQSQGFEVSGLEGIFLIAIAIPMVPIVVAVAGCIVSWWRERVGGSLLIFAYFLSVSHYLLDGGSQLVALFWWMISLPYLIAGVLFLTSSWLARKTSSSASTL